MIIFELLLLLAAAFAIAYTFAASDFLDDLRVKMFQGGRDENGDIRNTDTWFYPALIRALPQPVTDDDGSIVFKDDGSFEEVIECPMGYYSGTWGYIRGKLGDMLQCVLCLTAQVVWLLYAIQQFIGINEHILTALALIGLSYILNTLLSKG